LGGEPVAEADRFHGKTYVQIVDRVVTGGEVGPFKARLRECSAGGINRRQKIAADFSFDPQSTRPIRGGSLSGQSGD